LSKDLRSWIGVLERNGLLVSIEDETDIRYVATLVAENYRKATLFKKLIDYDIPLLVNSASNRKMIALALDTDEAKLLYEYEKRLNSPISPIYTSDAECQEIVYIGDEVDLTMYPIHLQHEYDGAPYISSAIIFAKDPESEVTNMGIYRLMFRSKDELGINLTAPHRLRKFYQKAYEQGRPLEVACVIGVHAADMLAAISTNPNLEDDLPLLCAMRGEKVKFVHCKTVDVYVPADCEIVLEGVIPPAGWVFEEGPYGEFPGTYSGMKRNPIIKVKAVTQRQQPIFQSATHGGKRLGWTDFYIIIVQIELSILQALRAANIDVKGVRVIPSSAGFWAIVSIKQWNKGDARNAIYITLASTPNNFPKYVVVVDEDIDIFDDEMVYWAMSTRTQPEEDVIIIKDLRVPSTSDPSLLKTSPPITTSKMGLDATKPFERKWENFKFAYPPYSSHPLVKNKKTAKNVDELAHEIYQLLSEKPRHFYEVLVQFEVSYRMFMQAWSKLISKGILGRDDEGRYLSIRG